MGQLPSRLAVLRAARHACFGLLCCVAACSRAPAPSESDDDGMLADSAGAIAAGRDADPPGHLADDADATASRDAHSDASAGSDAMAPRDTRHDAADASAEPVADATVSVEGGAADAATNDATLVGPRPIAADCLTGIESDAIPGPFDFHRADIDRIRVWVPDVRPGCELPMVHLSMGTGASCATYDVLLEGFASHGFLALCHDATTTGQGRQAVEAFEAALAEYPDLAGMRFGAFGHQTGGQGAFIAVQLSQARWGGEGLYAGFGLAPEAGFGAQPSAGGTWREVYAAIEAPMFMVSGDPSDGLVSKRWVQDGFDALDDSVEAYHWSQTGLMHIPIPQDVALELAIPWFRWKLLGDERACETLKSIETTDSTWSIAAVQNEMPCR